MRVKCAQPHLTRDCPGETAVKCANCGGEHPADYVNCKVRLRALARTKQFVHGPKLASPSNENTIPKSATFSATDTADAQETPSVAEQGAKPKGPPQKTKKKTRASTTIPPTPNQGPPRKPATSTDELKATDVSSRTANRRTYSDVVKADKRPQQPAPSVFCSMTIGDIICLVFSALRSFTAQLPPCAFKSILQGILVFEPAVIAMAGNSHQNNG